MYLVTEAIPYNAPCRQKTLRRGMYTHSRFSSQSRGKNLQRDGHSEVGFEFSLATKKMKPYVKQN